MDSSLDENLQDGKGLRWWAFAIRPHQVERHGLVCHEALASRNRDAEVEGGLPLS